MTDAAVKVQEIEPYGDDEVRVLPDTSGFRFKYFEVLNWGPFDNKVWQLDFKLSNALLTGKNGSGKSTLVDAITTLFESPGNIVYNKAAGAKSKERNITSYVMGHIREVSEGNDERTDYRTRTDFSVIAGVFFCQRLQRTVSLAQFFYFAGDNERPTIIYIGGRKEISINRDFRNFGRKAVDIKRHLRRLGFEIFDNFSAYKQWFMRELNWSERACALFKQCISMKDVANITSFVRDYMLDSGSCESLMQDLVNHFDDLTDCYKQILRARDEIAALSPVEQLSEMLSQKQHDLSQLENGRKGLDTFLSSRLLALIKNEEQKLQQEQLSCQARLQEDEHKLTELMHKQERLLRQHAQSGGDHIAVISQDIDHKRELLAVRSEHYSSYEKLTAAVGLNAAVNEEDFLKQRLEVGKLEPEYAQQVQAAQQTLIENKMAEGSLKKDEGRLNEEILSLGKRHSNLPSAQIELRQQIAAALRVEEERLPYVGELISVKDNEKKVWEGAIERVLHGFALSLLVPDELYPGVVSYVNSRNLGRRLVFYRMSDLGVGKSGQLAPNSLILKLAVKPDTEFTEALSLHLQQRFNLSCCSSEEEFRRQTEAVMPSGLIKQRRRHEKDDRRAVTDRSAYVLGWSNTEKISALRQELAALENQLRQIDTAVAAANQVLQQRMVQLQNLRRLSSEYTSFERLNTAALSAEISRLQQEKRRLQQENPDLQQLEEELKKCRTDLEQAGLCKDNRLKQLGSLDDKLQGRQKQSKALSDLLLKSEFDPQVELYLKPVYGTLPRRLNADNYNEVYRDLERLLNERAVGLSKAIAELQQSMVRALTSFNKDFPVESKELQPAVEYLPEYMQLLKVLREDNLPKFEQRFKEKLTGSTLSDIAHLRARLDEEEKQMKRRIEELNQSLKDIDYNPESFIQLKTKDSADDDIRQFKNELDTYLSYTFGKDEPLEVTEEKFQSFQELIDRFKGRADFLSEDLCWRRKVLDVRQWHNFAAIEYERLTGREREYYESSSAKSGGQKEKLAYTILAASLSYQVRRQEQDESRKDTAFRFLMIDEAFGSGSPELATYGLSLFKKLKLQVLVITPMTKIGEIEPYVSQVALARGKLGVPSTLSNMPIEHFILQYRQNRLAAAALQLAGKLNQSGEALSREQEHVLENMMENMAEEVFSKAASPDKNLQADAADPVPAPVLSENKDQEGSMAAVLAAAYDQDADPDELFWPQQSDPDVKKDTVCSELTPAERDLDISAQEELELAHREMEQRKQERQQAHADSELAHMIDAMAVRLDDRTGQGVSADKRAELRTDDAGADISQGLAGLASAGALFDELLSRKAQPAAAGAAGKTTQDNTTFSELDAELRALKQRMGNE